MIDRRALLSAAAAVPAATIAPKAGDHVAAISDDLARFVGFGVKASGGPGDMAAGAWIEAALRTTGYQVTRHEVDVPWFQASVATLSTGTARAAVLPQAVVVPTGPAGIAAPLVRVAPGLPATVDRAIALVDLPSSRWSSALARPIRDTVQAALAGGARAAVIVTNGPSGSALGLNAPGDAPLFDRPVAILAPRDAAPFLAAAAGGRQATLVVDGAAGRRPATNLIGKLDRGKGRWLIVSTPRSGWFICAGERGSGLATWLDLARWVPAALPHHDLAFVCTSGHEYEYLGADALMRSGMLPRPAATALWFHLGANVAARDWHELDGTALPSADAQRYLLTSPLLVSPARSAFAGLPGLEVPMTTDGTPAGELVGIIAAGYPRVAGIFGAHRYHHAREDDARCVSPALVAAALEGCRRFVAQALA